MNARVFVLTVLCMSVIAQGATITTEFANWMVKFNKQYDVAELPTRLANYERSKELIAKLNAEAARKGANTQYGLTKYADISPEEFRAIYYGYKAPSQQAPVSDISLKDPLPVSFDWRTKGAVTPVKDQGQCGSCWAFSATEGVESAWFLANNPLITLSPQQVVSCDTTDAGCDGGDLPTAFAYIKSAGLELEKDYPYTSGTSGDSGTCKYDQAKVVAHMDGFKYATQKMNETQMQVALTEHGPLSICVDAETWQYYTGGIVKTDCSTSLDHCVQIVGFNSNTKNVPYWIIRNSWGADWGESGYIYVERNHDLCGVAMEATYVTIN
jgi:C1A family cysteine protease